MFVPKIKLNHYDSRNLYLSNPILRNLINLKKNKHIKNINLLIHIQITYFFLTYVVIVKNCLLEFMHLFAFHAFVKN